jgi:SAM-dependent methyltransferase
VSGRERLASWMSGHGLELGPGHLPFPGAEALDVTYVDRWKPDHFRELFPELDGDVEVPDIDVYTDLDQQGLAAFSDDSQDFVICSHVLEHVAAPIALLEEMYRVLTPNGVLVLLLPDRRRTFDRYRPSTALDHLIREYLTDIRVVDDQHLFDFITLAEPGEAYTRRPDDWTRDEFYEWHRDRSIHVHCWTEDEFDEVLAYCTDTLRFRWEIVDRLPLDDAGFEFGYAIRKVPRWRWGRLGRLVERFT